MNENILNLLYKVKMNKKEKIAIIFNDKNVTYDELYKLSDIYYNFIVQEHIDKDVICVICKRSINLIACVIGIIRAGKAYFLLEPDDVNEGMISLLNTMPRKMVLVEEQNYLISNSILMDEIKENRNNTEFCFTRKQNDLLYLTCTSGSSKNEKIVMVEDRNLLCYINAYIKQFNITERDVILQQSPVYYDGFAEEVFSMLLVGGTIVLTDTINLKSPHKIMELAKKSSISILPSTPLMINEFNKLERMPSVRAIISSGDILKKTYISNLLEWTDVYNMYGLTETTVCATCYKCSVNDDEIIPIGKEIEGYKIILRDIAGNDIIDSKTGEAYILGQGVTRGYWNIDDDKEIIFCEHEVKIYKTGDYIWRDGHGILHYVGRKDRQIKIRGNKVNLNYIEEIIYEMDGLRNVAVITCGTEQNICAFFSSDNDQFIDVKKFCQDRLPYYMRPTQYIKVEEIPISKTGKTNYKYLRKIYSEKKSIDITAGDSFSYIEKEIVSCIIKVLETRINQIDISLNNSWEEIGIDSFTYIQLIVEIEKRLGVELNEEILLKGEFSTVKDLCNYIGEYINNGR